jgi:hypothetical protein
MHTAMLLAGSRRGWFRLAAGFLSLTGRARRPGRTGVLLITGLLAVLSYLLLRHEHDPLQDLTRPIQDDQDEVGS